MTDRDAGEYRAAVRRLALQVTGLIVLLLTGLAVSVFAIVGAGQAEAVARGLGQAESQEEMQRLLTALLISGSIAAAVAGFIGAFLAARAMKPIAEALTLQRRFIADASHELRTPLTLLSTRAQLLRRRITDDDPTSAVLARGVDDLVRDALALNEVLEQLLVAADPRETAARTPVELGETADGVIASFRADAEQRDISLERDGARGPVTIDGAPVAIRRLITALVSNALDHATSIVTVEVGTIGRDAVIRVRDDGPGFPPSAAPRAFDRFASGRPATASGDGTRHYGLGLALVAEVAVRHGGGVSIEAPSPSRTGASILVRLPLHAA